MKFRPGPVAFPMEPGCFAPRLGAGCDHRIGCAEGLYPAQSCDVSRGRARSRCRGRRRWGRMTDGCSPARQRSEMAGGRGADGGIGPRRFLAFAIPRSMLDGQRIAARVLDMLDLPPCGLRLASPTNGRPVPGPVLEGRMLKDGATVSMAMLRHPRASAAVVGELAEDLPRRGDEMPNLATLHPAIDISSWRLPEPPTTGALAAADLAGLGFIVCGKAEADGADARAHLARADRHLASRRGSRPRGGDDGGGAGRATGRRAAARARCWWCRWASRWSRRRASTCMPPSAGSAGSAPGSSSRRPRQAPRAGLACVISSLNSGNPD